MRLSSTKTERGRREGIKKKRNLPAGIISPPRSGRIASLRRGASLSPSFVCTQSKRLSLARDIDSVQISYRRLKRLRRDGLSRVNFPQIERVLKLKFPFWNYGKFFSKKKKWMNRSVLIHTLQMTSSWCHKGLVIPLTSSLLSQLTSWAPPSRTSLFSSSSNAKQQIVEQAKL